jgi:hypothetical protein
MRSASLARTRGAASCAATGVETKSHAAARPATKQRTKPIRLSLFNPGVRFRT